jgi:hypothetical protein
MILRRGLLDLLLDRPDLRREQRELVVHDHRPPPRGSRVECSHEIENLGFSSTADEQRSQEVFRPFGVLAFRLADSLWRGILSFRAKVILLLPGILRPLQETQGSKLRAHSNTPVGNHRSPSRLSTTKMSARSTFKQEHPLGTRATPLAPDEFVLPTSNAPRNLGRRQRGVSRASRPRYRVFDRFGEVKASRRCS